MYNTSSSGSKAAMLALDILLFVVPVLAAHRKCLKIFLRPISSTAEISSISRIDVNIYINASFNIPRDLHDLQTD